MILVRLLYLLIITGSFSGSLAAAPMDEAALANQSLSSGHPVEALTAYQSLLASPQLARFSSPELWYNRGLAEEKTGDPVAASLSYRRALLLDPTLSPAQTRLSELLRSLGVRTSALGWRDQVLLTLHPDLLVLGGSILGWASLFLFVFLFLVSPPRRRLLALALTGTILGHGLSLFGIFSDPRLRAVDEAVVTGKKVPTLRSTPADSGKADGTLAPGSLITILSRNGAWWKVSNGADTGWIPLTSVTPLLPSSAGS